MVATEQRDTTALEQAWAKLSPDAKRAVLTCSGPKLFSHLDRQHPELTEADKCAIVLALLHTDALA